MSENGTKAVFAVFDKNGRYVVRYDRDAVKSALKLRRVLLTEARRLMTAAGKAKKENNDERRN